MKLLLLAAVTAMAAFGQAADSPTRKMVELKTMDAGSIINSGVLNPFEVKAWADPSGRYLVLSAPEPRLLAAAEEVIRKIDTPPRSLELTFHIVAGVAQAIEDKMPAELESVVKQLRTSFVYKDYKLLDSAMMRARDAREASVSGSLPGNGTYAIWFKGLRLSSEQPGAYRIDNLRFSAKLPVRTGEAQFQYMETNLNTAVDGRAGQKLVVGKSTLPDTAIFLVVTAKVLD